MVIRIVICFALSILAAGCVNTAAPVVVAENHPTNPDAPESPIAAPTTTLAIGNAPTSTNAPPVDEGHDMSGMDRAMQGMHHDHPMTETRPATTRAGVAYTCSMHPQVVSDKPGKCPICGMKLVLKQEVKATDHGGHE